MAIYWPTPGFKGRTFKMCVLTRWDFYFCVCSSPLWGDCWKLGQLVSWCFEPSQPQGITSGLLETRSVSYLVLWAQSTTKVYIRAEHKLHSSQGHSFHKSSYHKSRFFFSLFIFCRHSTWEPASGRWPILFCRPTQEPCVSHSQHRKNQERFWKKCRWMDCKGRNKQGRNPWQ